MIHHKKKHSHYEHSPYRRLNSLSLLAIYIGCNGCNLGQSIWGYGIKCGAIYWEQLEDHMGTPRTQEKFHWTWWEHTLRTWCKHQYPKNKINFKTPPFPPPQKKIFDCCMIEASCWLHEVFILRIVGHHFWHELIPFSRSVGRRY